MAEKKHKGPVTRPLDPDVLTDLGALSDLPPPPAGFDPAGAWTAIYRIWTCYGYRGGRNETKGTLRLDRRPAGASHRLAVLQVVEQSEGKVHHVSAEVRCRSDALGSPTEWTLASRFDGEKMDGVPAMAFKAKGRLDGTAWETTAGGRTCRRAVPAPATGDWCLFEAVQRRPFEAAEPLRFAVLEGLSVVKADHRLTYDGSREVRWGAKTMTLHRFIQTGRGVYPYEYWLDGAHRLLLAVTGPRTYILDAKAGESRRLSRTLG